MSQTIGTRDIAVLGDIDGDTESYMIRRVAFCLDRIPTNSARAKIRLTNLASERLSRPALAQARLEIDGRIVRAQLAASSLDIACQRLTERLELQLTQFRGAPAPRPWPDHGDLLRPEPVPIPGGKRRIARVKSYRLASLTAQQAAHEMDLRDYDFHLFVNCDGGGDSLVFRVGPTGYRLSRLDGRTPIKPEGIAPITVDEYPVPCAMPDEIAARLDATDMDHRFFIDADTQRGAVVYRRYDGHYGLLRGT